MNTPTTHETLDKNPFSAYREPATGRWVIVYPNRKDDHNETKRQK